MLHLQSLINHYNWINYKIEKHTDFIIHIILKDALLIQESESNIKTPKTGHMEIAVIL